MRKFITLTDFGAAFVKETYRYGDLRLLSIGVTSDGYYTFRCKDKYDNEKVFKVPCWEEDKK